MKQGNRVLKRILSLKSIIIAFVIILCTSGVVVYAEETGLPEGVEAGYLSEDETGNNGNKEDYSGYNAVPITIIRYKLISKSTPSEAAEWVRENALTLGGYGSKAVGYRVGISGPSNTFVVGAQLHKYKGTNVETLLKTLIVGGTANWDDLDSWWKILEFLHGENRVSEAAYSYATNNKIDEKHKLFDGKKDPKLSNTYLRVDGRKGKQVALLAASGVYTYEQEDDHCVPGTGGRHTDISLIEGDILTKAYSNQSKAKAAIREALIKGEASNPAGQAYGVAFGLNRRGIPYTVGSYIGCYFKNYIKSPDGKNYYGRQYWIPGQNDDPIEEINITFEADAKAENGEQPLADGDIHEATFEVRFTASDADIENLQNEKGTYTLTITGKDPGNAATPKNLTKSEAVKIGSTKHDALKDLGKIKANKPEPSPTVTLEISNTKLAEMLTSGDGIRFNYEVKDDKEKVEDYELEGDLYSLYHTVKFDVSIKRKSKKGIEIGTVKPGRVETIYPTHHRTMKGDPSAAYVRWRSELPPEEVTVEVKAKPWTYSTEDDPTGYAEIVANQAGYILDSNGETRQAQDWNIHAGIPSTENLAVAIGGQTYIYDLAGWIVPVPQDGQVEISNKSDYNKELGLGLSTAAATRTITFDVIIDNWWGPDNNRCTLSCPGHTTTVKCEGSSSATCKGDQTACSVCGWQIATPAHNKTPHGTDEEGNPTDYYCDGVSDSSPCPKNASGTATYSHTTGQWTVSATNGSWVTTPGTMNAYTQAYEGGTAEFHCDHCGKIHGKTTIGPVGLIDQGYTKGYGCTCSKNHNNVHRQTKKYTFTVVEAVDLYVYREITYAKVNALTNATVKDFNPNVISAGGERKVSNSNLYAYMWRANGAYVNGNGRLWFTQFFDSAYNGTWTSTKVVAQNGTGSGYWLGDVKVTMHVNADSEAADVGSPEELDEAPPISMMRGFELMRYDNAASEMSPITDYQSNSGDKLSEEQCENLALHVINAWQNQNNEKYTVNVISDNYTTGASASSSMSAVFQNIIGDVYAVDEGLELFDYGFIPGDRKHYRTHWSTYSTNELQNKYLAKEFSFTDITDASRTVLQTGYKGTPSGDSRNKYGATYTLYTLGMNPHSQFYPVVRKVEQTATQYFANTTNGSATAINANKEYVTKGGANFFAGEVKATSGNYPYNNPITDEVVNVPGITKYDLTTVGTPTPEYFGGFYNTHYYPNIGNFKATLRMNYTPINEYDAITDSGDMNSARPYLFNGVNIYGNAMVVSNIDLRDYVANREYSNVLGACINYNQMTDFNYASPSGVGSLPAKIINDLKRDIDSNGYKCTYYKGYTNAVGQSGTVNDIVIHDPVSVEYCVVAGNGTGSYAPYVKDDTNQDQRVIYNDTPDSKKPNYVVMGNSFHFWWSDYGDFYDPNGSWDLVNRTDIRGVGSLLQANSDINGALFRDESGLSSAVGYSTNMKTSQWIKKRVIRFSFPVQYKDISGNIKHVPAEYPIDLSQVPCIDANGNRVLPTINNQRVAPTGLTNFANQNPEINTVPKYGWDFEFTVPTSTREYSSATITVFTEAKNNILTKFDEAAAEDTNKQRASMVANSYAVNNYNIQVVGRIGNLAIEDTSDFRFSELFKKAESTWLIPNVVHNVNINWPNRIISTPNDIMRTDASEGHSTTSVSAVEFNGDKFLGKAGPYDTLPLVASLNGSYGSKLFRQEQMRLGYQAYMDIDTMGDYYGYNIDSVVTETSVGNFSINRGPQSATQTVDTREKVMTIKPVYVLYDYEKGTYHDIDLYYGKQGAYQRYWSAGLGINDPTSSLYVDLPGNMGRWNTDLAENYVTESVFTSKGFLDISAFTGEDYIGTADKIVLDAYNRTFIGSSIMNGALTWNTTTGEVRSTSESYTVSNVFNLPTQWQLPYSPYAGVGYGFNEEDYAIQAQRWYFTMGVPSSSYVVPAATVPNNQIAIERAHNELKAQHPNSVILCYAAITVKGNIWELEYDYGKANGTTSITLFNDIKDIPDSVANKNTVPKTINPVGHNGITSKMAPILTMDAWHTSAEDWDTYGTH